MILSDEIYNKRRSAEIQDEQNVLVVNPKNIEQFKELLERVIKNPADAEKIGQQARLVSEKIERFDEYVEDTISLYKEVLRESSTA